ncbi:hypothetical protein TNCV_1933561 [Trichonephila clavipes]|nr:hypothetical protein TNCV_1933561 [Trichonephila clavipes]
MEKPIFDQIKIDINVFVLDTVNKVQSFAGSIVRPYLPCLPLMGEGYVKSMIHEATINSSKDHVAGIAAAAGDIRDTASFFANVQSSVYRRCETYLVEWHRDLKHTFF